MKIHIPPQVRFKMQAQIVRLRPVANGYNSLQNIWLSGISWSSINVGFLFRPAAIWLHTVGKVNSVQLTFVGELEGKSGPTLGRWKGRYPFSQQVANRRCFLRSKSNGRIRVGAADWKVGNRKRGPAFWKGPNRGQSRQAAGSLAALPSIGPLSKCRPPFPISNLPISGPHPYSAVAFRPEKTPSIRYLLGKRISPFPPT